MKDFLKFFKKVKPFLMLFLAIVGTVLLVRAISLAPPRIYVKDIMAEDGLLLEIHVGTLNCGAVSLMLYQDNTYKYQDTFNEEAKTGTYTTDVLKMLEESNTTNGEYFLTTGKGDIYCTTLENPYLKNLLTETQIDLLQCKLFTS